MSVARSQVTFCSYLYPSALSLSSINTTHKQPPAVEKMNKQTNMKETTQPKSLRLRMTRFFNKGKKNLNIFPMKDDCTVDTLNLSGRSHDSIKSIRSESETRSESLTAARMSALKQLQQIEGNSHPDVLFAMKYLARAHRRNGDVVISQQMEEIIHTQHIIQSQRSLVSL